MTYVSPNLPMFSPTTVLRYTVINVYEDLYPLLKQEAAKKAGQLRIRYVFVFIVVCKGDSE